MLKQRTPLRRTPFRKKPVVKRLKPVRNPVKPLSVKQKRELGPQLLAQHNSSCFYCGVRLSLSTMTFDHLHPRSAGGTHDLSNLAPACFGCNVEKGARPVSWMLERAKARRKTAKITSYIGRDISTKKGSSR